MELRFSKTEVRAVEISGVPNIQGYAAKYNTLSGDLGGFKERIAPGAFARSLKEGCDCRCLYNHDQNLVLGRTKSGTLSLQEDKVGLNFLCTLPDTSYARDLHTLIKRGDVSQCSFAFTVQDDEWGVGLDDEGEQCSIRTLRDVNLMDVSAVTYPAYEDTQVSARQLFPDGIPDGMPVEVRSRLWTRANQETRDSWEMAARRRVRNFILS